MTAVPVESPAVAAAPLAGFSHCHEAILHTLHAAEALPQQVRAAQAARATARQLLELFRDAVPVHHAEEEAELFTAVVRSAQPAESREVALLVAQLTAEHRSIESEWKRLEPAVRRIARGEAADLDADDLAELVQDYVAHARLEESRFLPLAEKILGRDGNHMAALGLALHMRHVQLPAGYV